MKWIKIISINVIIFSSFLGIMFLTPPLVNYGWKFIKGSSNINENDKRYQLELYSDYSWAETHFKEFNELETTYYDFITWRRNDFNGLTINIKDGLRVSSKSTIKNKSSSEFWFFGGSTTWGTGVNDDYTYPSLFAQSTSSKAINFGESAYISRQSLAYLNNYIISNNIVDMSDINVVFYDGVNEVLHRCRTEINQLGTGRENQIQNALESLKTNHELEFSKTFSQLKSFISIINNKIFPSKNNYDTVEKMYDCKSNPKRAFEVAQSLVNVWEITSDLVNSRGGKFTAILQPVSFLGKADIEYLGLTDLENTPLAIQYRTVYPLIAKIAKKRDINFYDFTEVYDGCSDCYIDFCHVGPQGHKILTQKLEKILINK